MIRNGKPIDLGHLDSYTGGNRALNEEVLRLFETHCHEMLEKLEGAIGNSEGAKAWREAAHTLKGAARGIGAFALADAAANAEKAQAAGSGSLIGALEQIKIQSAAVQLFIEEFLKRDN